MDYLNKDPKYLHFTALHMWANYIETGDPTMGSEDAIKCRQKDDVRVLTDDQKRLVLKLRDEARLTLQNGLRAKLSE